MGDLCTACMCSGRNLYYIGETGFYHLFSQILNEIQIYDSSPFYIRVCWECVAHLRTWAKFKERAKRSYTQLQYVQQNNFTQEPRPPHLGISHVYNFTIPEPPIKTESGDPTTSLDCEEDRLQDVKTEDTHCEPASFVNDLDVEPKKRRKKVDKLVPGAPFGTESGDPTKSLDCEGDRLQDVKTEETHCEPASFVNDLDVEPKKRRKKVDKPIKEKSKKKVKPKTEKIPVKKKIKVKKKRSPSPDSLPDDHMDASDLDLENDDDDDDVKDKTGDVAESKVEIEVPAVKENKRLNGEAKATKEAPLKETLPERPHCEECGKNFSSRKTYRYHLNVLHKGQNRYPCPRCGKVYQWKSNLGRHLRSHKARDSGELYCETCDKRFASVATYRQHLRVSRRHVPESDFSFMCNECGKKFVNKTRLRDHIDWEHLKKIKFRCQLCNKPFKCHTSLYVHMQNVHRNKEKKDNLCHVCGKSYQNAAKLKYHIVAMHTSETPYQCQQCSAAFGWYSSLYRHVREVHYKMKLQPKKLKKSKKTDLIPSLLPLEVVIPPMHQPGLP
ncbi:hypothetical protein PYW07_012851 [Mythimna separata]|uniref:C2H2-type domain-containing protein n=1 Tax=Mythimna separata TaxID=271217 RepID=A0AAD7Y8R1_MYTSE|nr:hypothetical protein PYW07_012851 [Mythimna separata]